MPHAYCVLQLEDAFLKYGIQNHTQFVFTTAVPSVLAQKIAYCTFVDVFVCCKCSVRESTDTAQNERYCVYLIHTRVTLLHFVQTWERKDRFQLQRKRYETNMNRNESVRWERERARAPVERFKCGYTVKMHGDSTTHDSSSLILLRQRCWIFHFYFNALLCISVSLLHCCPFARLPACLPFAILILLLLCCCCFHFYLLIQFIIICHDRYFVLSNIYCTLLTYIQTLHILDFDRAVLSICICHMWTLNISM